MIAINTLAQTIEAGLNNNTLGVAYKLFVDEGEFKEALNTHYEKQVYTNGILRIVSSSVVPAQNLSIATQTAQLEFAVQLFGKEPDEAVIQRHRTILDSYFANTTVTELTDESGKSYSVGQVYSLANSGITAAESPLGTHVTFIVNLNLSYIQNGLNSLNCKIFLDGVQLAYTTADITRVPVADGNAYSISGGAAKNLMTSTALDFDIKLPATDTENGAGAAVLDFLLDGNMNTVHELTLEIAEEPRTFKVIYGKTNMALDGIQNAGNSLNFIEAAPILEEEENG